MDSLAQHQTGLIVFVCVLLVIALGNLFAWRRLEHYRSPARWPRLSVLVPARDEAQNIAACLGTLAAQDYPDFEVVALDDNSCDGTAGIIAACAARDARIRALTGAPLPPGWLGKHWACHQLAQAANGDLLLFVDADTRLHPHALRDAVAALEAERAGLLSALPRQVAISWGERLTVPIIPWALFCFLPLALAHRLQWAPLTAAIGQFMLFRRDAYARCGGHAAVRAHAADDLALARAVAAGRLGWRLADGGGRVSCRMYGGLQEALEGFGKNLYAAFDYRAWLFLPIWSWLALVFLEPPVVLAAWLAGVPLPASAPLLAGTAVALSVLLWLVVCVRLALPRYLALLYPAILATAFVLAVRSLVLAWAGAATWKGRRLAARRRGRDQA